MTTLRRAPEAHAATARPRRAASADDSRVMVGRGRVLAALLLLFAAGAAAAAGAVHANGSVVGLQTLRAGPYELSVGTVPKNPQVGVFHMTMTVADASTKDYLLDADVRITGVGPDGTEDEVGPIAAAASVRDPLFYEANPAVDREGRWVFTIAVAGELGEGSTELPVEVREANPLVGIVTLLALAAFLVIIGLSVRAYLRERRAS